jgi:hypothetical protein
MSCADVVKKLDHQMVKVSDRGRGTGLLTARQSMAVSLIREGFKQVQAAKVMGIWPESFCRLLARANERIDRQRKICIDRGQCCVMEILAK